MTMIVKAQLKSLEVKGADNNKKFEVTKELIRQCYQKGYSRNDIRVILNFFSWVIRLPDSLRERIKYEIKKVEEEFKMEYIPIWERDSHEEGMEKGIKKGKREGIKEGKIETAKRMLNDDFPIKNIAKYTGLSEKEIKALMH
jgi:flagellar biosynthesis/type III secretory pathway protein FliH